MSKFWKSLISIILVLVVALSVSVGIITNGFKNWSSIKSKIYGKEKSSQEDSVANIEQQIVLTKLNAQVFSVENEKYISQKISATIKPDTVLDKYVSWSIAWENSDCPLGEISDFLKITDDSQGNLTATLNCYKSFKGYKAILTCTARQGGLTATADVVYEGIPSYLSFDFSKESYVSEYDLGKGKVSLLYVDRPGSKYYRGDLNFSNIFGPVDTPIRDFSDLDNLKVTLKGVGSVKICDAFTDLRGAIAKRNKKEVSLQSLIDKNIKPFVDIDIGIDSGVSCFVNIKPLLSLENYFESEDLDGGSYDDGYGYTTAKFGMVYDYVLDADGNKPYFILNVSCEKYNISCDYKFYIGDFVQNVSLSKKEIKF